MGGGGGEVIDIIQPFIKERSMINCQRENITNTCISVPKLQTIIGVRRGMGGGGGDSHHTPWYLVN